MKTSNVSKNAVLVNSISVANGLVNFYFANTRTGFAHYAEFVPTFGPDQIERVNYINRTWEAKRFATVARCLAEKMTRYAQSADDLKRWARA